MKKKSLSVAFRTILVTTLIAGSSIFFSGCQKGTESPFIVTDDASEITNNSETQSMYKTDLNLDEVLSFYREKLTASNLKERELLTVQSDTTLNLVFDGSENGEALIIQAVVINDYTNVVIRFEEI